MRRSVTTALMVCLLGIPQVGIASGQGEEPLDDPDAARRIEVVEAGIALSFPSDWAVDIEMVQREDFELSEELAGAGPAVYWDVLYASAAGRPWCELMWYPQWPLTLTEQVALHAARLQPDPAPAVERAVVVTPVELGIGAAARVDSHNEPTGDTTVGYLFESDAALYLLACVADTREEIDGLGIVDTVEFLQPQSMTSVADGH